jgi:hypothetical protein
MDQTNAGMAEVIGSGAERLTLVAAPIGIGGFRVIHAMSGKELGLVACVGRYTAPDESHVTWGYDCPQGSSGSWPGFTTPEAAAEAMAAVILDAEMDGAPYRLRPPCEGCGAPTLDKDLRLIDNEGECLDVCPTCYDRHIEERERERELDELNVLADALRPDPDPEPLPDPTRWQLFRTRISNTFGRTSFGPINDNVSIAIGKRYVFETMLFPRRHRRIFDPRTWGSVTDARNAVYDAPGTYRLERHGALAASILFDVFGTAASDQLLDFFNERFGYCMRPGLDITGDQIAKWLGQHSDVPWVQAFTENLPRQVIRRWRHR